MMDDKNNDSSNDSSDSSEFIENGFFGIADKESKCEFKAVHSDCSDDCIMEIEDGVIVNNTTRFDESNHQNETKPKNDNHSIVVENEECERKNETHFEQINKNKSFGSHILCSKSTDFNNSVQVPSFAALSQSYGELRKDHVSKNLALSPENPAIDKPVLQPDSKSSVVLSKSNISSTLSLISQNYQDSSSDSDSSTDEEDSCNEEDDDILIDSDDEDSIISSTALKDDIKTKGELDICDLPPIEDLKISMDEEKCQPVGCIKSVVETLVIVETFFNQSALDIDSVLFVDRGQRALGKIFDVFGPVSKPFYAVRFNSSDHIKKFNIQIKEPVYCAPQTEYASYVLVPQLLKQKGSDASWKHNNEPPPEFLDYSDDEIEKQVKKNKKKNSSYERNDLGVEGESSNHPKKNAAQNRPFVNNRPQSSAQYSNQTQHTYRPRPPNHNNYSPRPFPTYAQHLSSMEYSHSYRQPYNPQYYSEMSPPQRYNNQHQHQHQHQQRPYMPPRFNYRSPQRPPNPNPNQYY